MDGTHNVGPVVGGPRLVVAVLGAAVGVQDGAWMDIIGLGYAAEEVEVVLLNLGVDVLNSVVSMSPPRPA